MPAQGILAAYSGVIPDLGRTAHTLVGARMYSPAAPLGAAGGRWPKTRSPMAKVSILGEVAVTMPQKSEQGVVEVRRMKERTKEGMACRSSGSLKLAGLREVARTRTRSSLVEPGERVGVGTEGLRERFFSMPPVVLVNCQARMVVVGGAAIGEDILVVGMVEVLVV